MLEDVIFHAFKRKFNLVDLNENYKEIFIVITQDISRADNLMLAQSSKAITDALGSIAGIMAGPKTLAKIGLRILSEFSGYPINEEEIETTIKEIEELKKQSEAKEIKPEIKPEPAENQDSEEKNDE